MKKHIIFYFFMFTVTSISYSQKTVNTYEPAYIINMNLLEKLAKESKLRVKNNSIGKILMKYPILDNLDSYSKKNKYCMINTNLIFSTKETNKFYIFYMKDNITYKIKKNKRIFSDNLK